MNYYIDTEFHEYFRKSTFGKPYHTIELISIGIVSSDGREYYAVSKDFDIKKAWNSWQPRTGQGDRNNIEPRHYWLRENVLLPIFEELCYNEYMLLNNSEAREWIDFIKQDAVPFERFKILFLNDEHCKIYAPEWNFTYRNFKNIIRRNGKSNKKIAEEIKLFTNPQSVRAKDYLSQCDFVSNVGYLPKNPTFYGYYCDYDWVLFCSLFGRMNDFPRGFPMYCRDIYQVLEQVAENMKQVDFSKLHVARGNWTITNEIPQNVIDIDTMSLEARVSILKDHPAYPKELSGHHALEDARWTKLLHEFVVSLP